MLELTVIINEFRKGMLNLWAHRAPVLISVFGFWAMFIGVWYVIGRGKLSHDIIALSLVGAAAFMSLWIASLQIVADQLEEMRTGTLEHAHMSPAPPGLLVVGRLGAAALQGVIVSAAIIIGVRLAVGINVPWRNQVILPAALTLIDVLAFAVIFAGLALIVPFIGELHHVVTGFVGTFGGAFLPVILYPGWLAFIARLLPTALGVEAIQEGLYGAHPALNDPNAGTLPRHALAWAAVYTAILVPLAWFVYRRSYSRVVKDGGLGRY